MLNVNTETVRFIIDKAHEFQMLDVEPEDDSVEARDPPMRSSKPRSTTSSPISRSISSRSCGSDEETIAPKSGSARSRTRAIVGTSGPPNT